MAARPGTPLSVEKRECPLCYARGTVGGRPMRRDTPRELRCPLCDGSGTVERAQIVLLHLLREEMQRVADLMQVGDSEGAAARVRVAARLVHAIAPNV